MGKKTEERPSLGDVLASAGEDDLKSLQEVISDQEQRLRDHIEDRRKQIDALKAAAKIVELKLHGKPPKVGKPAGEGAAPQLRERIHDLIGREGPLSVTQVAAHLNVSKQAVAMSVGKSNWFRRHGDEVSNA